MVDAVEQTRANALGKRPAQVIALLPYLFILMRRCVTAQCLPSTNNNPSQCFLTDEGKARNRPNN